MVKRKSIIIYFRSPKAVKQIEKFAPVNYYNKKRRYAISYVNEENLEKTITQLKAVKLVKRVEESLFVTDEYQIDFGVK